MPPAGAFGLNTAVQDAHNLAWKLARVLRGEAAQDILGSYEQERLPVARKAVRYSEQEMESPQPWEHEGTEEQSGNPWESSLEDQLKEVIGTQYESSAVVPGARIEGLAFRAQPGTRFPHLWVEPGVSTLDLLPDGAAIVTAADVSHETSLPIVKLPARLWEQIADHEAALVRPDGIVMAAGSIPELIAAWTREPFAVPN
jgi:putative polyketide hydroxylase